MSEPVIGEHIAEEPTAEEPLMSEPVIAAVLPDVATNGYTPKHLDSDVPATNNAEISPETTYQSPVDAPIVDNKRQADLWSPGATIETPTSLAPETPAGLTPSADQPSYAAAFSALPPIRRSSTFDYNSVTRHTKTLSTDGAEQDEIGRAHV